MGKSLKGKELGKGIRQRKNGTYTARFVKKNGERPEKSFASLVECRKWLEAAKKADEDYEETPEGKGFREDITLNEWFDSWINNIKKYNVKPTTSYTYQSQYRCHIQECIGQMPVSEIRTIDCQEVINRMAETNTKSFIQSIRTLLFSIMESAQENQLITINPVTKSVKCKSNKKSDPIVPLTKQEQKDFLSAARVSSYYNAFALVLQTGIRVGELTGLQWPDFDSKKKQLHINRTMSYYSSKGWYSGLPKSDESRRSIPLTQEAVRILENQRLKIETLKNIPEEYKNFIFLNKNGKPITARSYDTAIDNITSKIPMRSFGIHVLRHTFATRCIEAEMKPKTLQTLLGHSDLSITMNLYVHIDNTEKEREIKNVESALIVL